MNWWSSTQWRLQGIIRWAAHQSHLLSSTANQIRLLLELVTVQSSHAAARTPSKGKENFRNMLLLSAESPNYRSLSTAGGLLMMSFRGPFRASFRCAVSLSQTKLIFKQMHRFYQAGTCSTAMWHQRWILLIISTRLWRTTITFIPRQGAGLGEGEAVFIVIKSQYKLHQKLVQTDKNLRDVTCGRRIGNLVVNENFSCGSLSPSENRVGC